MYDSILIPTDGSEIAERAGQFAISMARRFDAELHVIAVEMTGRERSEETWGERATEAVAALAREADLEPESTVVDAERSVHGAIIQYAEEHDVGCIVMGTHGRTGVNRFLLGSVAEQTLRESPIPVVTVHEDTDIEFDVERVLVPTDGSDGAEAAAEHAIDLAIETGATLHVLYVTRSDFGDVLEETPSGPIDDVVASAEEAGLEAVETATRHGRPHMEIAGYTTEAEIDCVVMGTHGRTGLRRYLLGSVTERTVRFSPVPVISIKPPRVTATVEFLDYEVLEAEGWSLEDEDLFEKAKAADLDAKSYGTMDVDQGEYVLEAAEGEGYDWPFHCRAGACVNCAAVLLDGEVEMEQNRSLSEEEIEEQNVRLTCVGTPTTENVRLVYNAKELDFLEDRVL